MYDIYNDCDPKPSEHAVTVAIAEVSNNILSVINDGIVNLGKHIKDTGKPLATAARVVKQKIGRANASNTTLVKALLDSVDSIVNTSKAENQVVANAEQAQAEQADTPGVAVAAPISQNSEIVGNAGTITNVVGDVGIETGQATPFPLHACTDSAAAPYVDIVGAWCFAQPDKAKALADIGAWQQQVALYQAANPPTSTGPGACGQALASASDSGGDFPVDLDEPLAFKFAPDDNKWKAKAEAFVGDSLKTWNSAATLDDIWKSINVANPEAVQESAPT